MAKNISHSINTLPMQQIQIHFEQKLDIPKSHFHAFLVCNSAAGWHRKGLFYELKTKLLKQFGHDADYDLQIIKKICNTCNGTGVFKCSWKLPETCWSCHGFKIYQTKEVILKRYILNESLFHEPIGEYLAAYNKVKIFASYDDRGPYFTEIPFNGKIIEKINGLIKHEPIKDNDTWYFYYLLWNYDRVLFYKCISNDVNCYSKKQKNKLKKLLERNNPLKVFADFFKIKKEEINQFDDLPF